MSQKGIGAYLQLGEKLKAARKAGGYSQKDFADLLNVASSTYSNYENGNRTPSAEMLQKASKILKTPLHELFSIDRPPSQSLVFFDWLSTIGYNVVVYDEEEYRTVNLRDTATQELHGITDSELDEMRDKVAAFTRFQVAELIASRTAGNGE